MPEPRWGATAVWDGTEALFIGGTLADASGPTSDGVAFSPATGRWSAMPMAPLRGRSNPTAVWTGRQVLVWGGTIPGPQKNIPATDGAAYRPASR